LEDNKAKDISAINLKGKSDIADYMIVATGTSNRHVSAIAQNLVQTLREAGIKSIDPEGGDIGDWVLIDLFDIVVHIMQPEAREKYKLEDMWQVKPDSRKAEKKEKVVKVAKVEKPKKPAVKKSAVKKPAAKKAVVKKK
jgi:ribosome-associated protein